MPRAPTGAFCQTRPRRVHHVYWTDDLDRLQRISIHGGAATTLAVGNNMAGIAVDATSVYWTTAATCKTAPRRAAARA